MLLEFKCSNHKSIKETVTFSMLAGSDNTHEERLKKFDNFRVSRSSVIYGANGSGKSNFINALAFMRSLVINSVNKPPGEPIFQARHKLSHENTPSEYAIQFVWNDVRYAYGFSVKQHLIQREYLYYFPKGRKVKIFERNGMQISSGNKYKKSFEVSEREILKENRLFLSCASHFSNVKETEEVFKFFYFGIVVYNPESEEDSDNWLLYSLGIMQNDEKLKEIFVGMLQELGTGIKDVKIKTEKMRNSDLQQGLQPPDGFKDAVTPEAKYKIETTLVYDKFETELLNEESAGVIRLLQMIGPMLDILKSGRVLICDEIEKSLHEYIIFRVIALFQLWPKGNCAQLIFSTHNTNLLDADLFRRDQIWFTELNKERATDLYSLLEIKNVRKSENLANGYMAGKYGAIPMLKKRSSQKLRQWLSEG